MSPRGKRLIYSVCLGDYDKIPPLVPSEGFDHVMFTDNPRLECPGWDVRLVKAKADIKKQSREIKLLIHKFIKADLYIYLDANYEVLRDLGSFIDLYFFGGYTGTRHPGRDCVYQEAQRVIELEKVPEDVVKHQVGVYRSRGLPTHARLLANGFFVRDSTFNKFCERWFAEVDKHCYRDQLSLPYLIWKERPTMTVLDWHLKDPWLRLHPQHNSTIEPQAPKIWYFVPGAGDKNLGKTLNEHCALVPRETDWILIRDNDTAFLHPYINKQLEDIIDRHGHQFDLLSCYTNRLGLPWQLPYGLSTNPDMLHHRSLAEKHYAEHYDEVIPSGKATAGLFMLFQKKTWAAHPFAQGLASDGDFIDYQFSNGLLQKGMRIGICTGIYMLHYYRLHQSDPREHKHLMA